MASIGKAILVAGLSLAVLSACSTTTQEQATDVTTSASIRTPREIIKSPVKRTDYLLGTVIALSVYHPNTEDLLTQAVDLVKDLESKITVNRDGSEVDAINEKAGIEPVVVSQEVFDLIEEGLDYSEEFEGKFDITVGPLVDLWHIGFEDAKKPTQEEIDAVLPLIDYKKVTLDKDKRTVFLQEKGMKLDLGGIAKGYIADRIWDLFKQEGVTTAVIDLGGNIVVMGGSPARNNEFWKVGVQNPYESRGTTLGAVPSKDQTLVTSGIYERYLEVDGVKYHHILDPKTGYPYDNDLAGVTIVMDSSTKGDALSTSMFALGIQAGLDYVNQQTDFGAIFVDKENKVYVSDNLKDSFELTDRDFEVVD